MKTMNFSSYNNMHPFYCLHCGQNFKDYPCLYVHVIRETVGLEYLALEELQKEKPKGSEPDKLTLERAKNIAHNLMVASKIKYGERPRAIKKIDVC